MNIGFVSTWFERGASYVTRSYIELLKDNHNISIYSRGNDYSRKKDINWNDTNVTWSPDLMGTNINFNHIKKWIKKNKLDIIFFNEQWEIEVVYKIRNEFPDIKLASYIDYYKENTVEDFNLYDFLICNTKRHYSVFKNHPQCFYVPWGTDTNMFAFNNKKLEDNILTFFHSAGMSNRKGTTFVIDCFIEGELYKSSKLIVHTQKDFEKNFDYNLEDLKKYNIEIIEKTVTAPGLYYLGDVYVYPTTLDGLGLTMYEALSSGLPVITTNHPPMNEVINNDVGRLVEVEYYRTRGDAYYWPLAIVNKKSLINQMKYYIENKEKIHLFKSKARSEALEKWKWIDRKQKINEIFENTVRLDNRNHYSLIKKKKIEERLLNKLGSSYFYSFYKKYRFKK